MKIEYTQDVEVVRPLVERWRAASAVAAFGFDARVEDVLADLKSWLAECRGTLIVARGDEEPVGFYAVFLAPNYLHAGATLAVEKYWYALANAELVGPQLFHQAWEWSKARGATHLMVSASHMMPASHDRIARFCRSMGMQPFESSFIREI